MSEKNKADIDRRVAIAPMMKWTHRHFRYLLRLLSKNVLLYTEMVVAQAIVCGNQQKLLAFAKEEHPVALQLGGRCQKNLTEAAKIGEQYGYDEINLNIGCPSPNVGKGQFGACLMKEPKQVAKCLKAMQQAVSIPVTVKTRIGVDNQNGLSTLDDFVNHVVDSGCKTVIIHARKAWLKGLNPKQNRNIPPLQYERVYQLKQRFPNTTIIINGGINSLELIIQQLKQLDGVMIGRKICQEPYFLSQIDQHLFGTLKPLTRKQILNVYQPYFEQQLRKKTRLSLLLQPILRLFHQQPQGKTWRHKLSQYINKHHQSNNRLFEEIISLAEQLEKN